MVDFWWNFRKSYWCLIEGLIFFGRFPCFWETAFLSESWLSTVTPDFSTTSVSYNDTTQLTFIITWHTNSFVYVFVYLCLSLFFLFTFVYLCLYFCMFLFISALLSISTYKYRVEFSQYVFSFTFFFTIFTNYSSLNKGWLNLRRTRRLFHSGFDWCLSRFLLPAWIASREKKIDINK